MHHVHLIGAHIHNVDIEDGRILYIAAVGNASAIVRPPAKAVDDLRRIGELTELLPITAKQKQLGALVTAHVRTEDHLIGDGRVRHLKDA